MDFHRTGVFNGKSGVGEVRALRDRVAQLVDITAARRKQVRSDALVRGIEHVWSLPHLDPSQIQWVGVDPGAAHELGTARVETLQQSSADILGGLVPQGVTASFEHLGLSTVIVEEDDREGIFPLPMALHPRIPFSESGLGDYPVQRQGFIGRESPTRRVHTLGDLLKEQDVWPSSLSWALPHVPVYRGLAFVPQPANVPDSPSAFFPDYAFALSGGRPLVVHRVIEDRYAGVVYNPPPDKAPMFAPHSWGLLMQDVEYTGDPDTLADPSSMSYVYFRAGRAPSLTGEAGEVNPVSGRFVFIVMQQLAVEPPRLAARDDDGFRSPTLGMKGADVGYTSVGVGRRSSVPFKVGEGADIDTRILPTIFDLRVLGVRPRQEVASSDIDNVVNLFGT